jgi:hypothetical protein
VTGGSPARILRNAEKRDALKMLASALLWSDKEEKVGSQLHGKSYGEVQAEAARLKERPS